MGRLWNAVKRRVGTARLLRIGLNLYPPYLGAWVRVRSIADDLSRIEVEMPLRPTNRNYVGTHFGGSLYAMTDPFYMLMLIERLGPDYVVWDKAASIRFRRPGRGAVRAVFVVDDDDLEEIRRRVAENGTAEPVFRVEVVDRDGDVVAEVEKVLWVRRRRHDRDPPG